MDKRDLSALFRTRLVALLEREHGPTADFLRDTGLDRSALSQFLDPKLDRLPRAEALRRIASARGVTVDWLLGLDNAPTGRKPVAPSIEIEQPAPGEIAPLDRWRAEAEGQKLRYVPATLPDMMSMRTTQIDDAQTEQNIRGGGLENMLDGMILGDMDVEIAMPIQTLQDLACQTGLWRDADPALCARQLAHMAQEYGKNFPALRLHLYDGSKIYSAPFTVFGKQRVALYVGDAYLVTTTRSDINTFVRRFDQLVRATLVTPDQTGKLLQELADQVKV